MVRADIATISLKAKPRHDQNIANIMSLIQLHIALCRGEIHKGPFSPPCAKNLLFFHGGNKNIFLYKTYFLTII